MTQIEQIEKLFYEARRSAFLVSFLCFIGTGISLSALSALDPALGIVIPALGLMVLALFTLFFLLLTFRLFQPINEIVKMTNKLYSAIMREEELEPTGAGAETEKGYLELTQQVNELLKEVSDLKKGQMSAATKQDTFWRNLTLKWAIFVALICGITLIIGLPLDMFFIMVGVAGVTIIALIYAHNMGRLKWPRGEKT